VSRTWQSGNRGEHRRCADDSRAVVHCLSIVADGQGDAVHDLLKIAHLHGGVAGHLASTSHELDPDDHDILSISHEHCSVVHDLWLISLEI
jgi:hypothetical protein